MMSPDFYSYLLGFVGATVFWVLVGFVWYKWDTRHVVSKENFMEDPYHKWCSAHIDLLRQYPDSHVAIDIETNTIVAHGKTNEEFEKSLDAYDPEKLHQLFLIHTSRYV